MTAGIPGGIARVRIVGQEDGAVVVQDLVEDRAEGVEAVGLVIELDDAVAHVLIGEGIDVEIGVDNVRLLVAIEAVADIGGLEGERLAHAPGMDRSPRTGGTSSCKADLCRERRRGRI